MDVGILHDRPAHRPPRGRRGRPDREHRPRLPRPDREPPPLRADLDRRRRGARLSVGVGLVLFITVGGFEEPHEQIFEGTTMLLAAAVVTWMLFWMRRQARPTSRASCRPRIDRALTDGGAWGLAILAFTAVIREGIETSLFLVGQATVRRRPTAARRASSSARCRPRDRRRCIGYGFYRGSQRHQPRARSSAGPASP